MSTEEVRNAALGGDSKAQFVLALNYHFGGPLASRDMKQAVHWYELAAKGGEVGAQVALALAYGKGEGIPTDLVRAYAWATIAAEKEAVALKAKNELSRSMTVSDIQRGTRLAEELTQSTRAQSTSKKLPENLQVEYERFLKDCGLSADSLQRPSRWADKIFKEVKRTDHAESPNATFQHHFPDLERGVKQFMSTGPGYLPFIDHISGTLEKEIPLLGLKMPLEVLVREFPTASFNAQVHPVQRGALILINTGLFAFLHKAIKLMQPLMETVRVDGKGHYDGSVVDAHFVESLGGSEISFNQAVDLFSELIFAYLAGDFNFARRLPSSGGPRGVLGGMLLTSCETFAIAHEYGHVIAGHVSSRATKFARTPAGSVAFVYKSRDQELQADRLAGQLLLKSQISPQNTDGASLMTAIAAPVVFLGLDGFVSGVEKELVRKGLIPAFDETHPSASDRIASLKKMFADLPKLRQFAQLADSCEWWLAEVSRGVQNQLESDVEKWFHRRIHNVFHLYGVA
jgi:hypothetical protein